MPIILKMKEGDITEDMLPVIPKELGGLGSQTLQQALNSLAGLTDGFPIGMPLSYHSLEETQLASQSTTTDNVCDDNMKIVLFTHDAINHSICLTDAPEDEGYCLLTHERVYGNAQGLFWSKTGEFYMYYSGGWHKIYTDPDVVPLSTQADYSSEDHSKGTIEERLTALGF